MAKFFTPMDNFDEVDMYYRNTTPVRKHKPEDRDKLIWQDVRPTNCRNRQLESVRKLSKNKYAICDYDTYWGFHFAEFEAYICTDPKTFNAFIEATAPILWERKRNGDEILTIRNVFAYGLYGPLPIGRCDFLTRHLPRQWYVSSEGGNQYLRNPMANFVLPKNTFLPKMIRVPRIGDTPELTVEFFHRFKEYTSRAQTRENKKLVFVRRDGQWLSPDKVYKPLKWRIDTKRKKKVQPVIRKFVDGNLPMISMLMGNVAYRDEDIKAMVGYLDEKVLEQEGERRWPNTTEYSLVRSRLTLEGTKLLHKEILNIMRDPEHEHTLGLIKRLVLYVQESDGQQSDLRTKINNWVNTFFGFKHKVEA